MHNSSKVTSDEWHLLQSCQIDQNFSVLQSLLIANQRLQFVDHFHLSEHKFFNMAVDCLTAKLDAVQFNDFRIQSRQFVS